MDGYYSELLSSYLDGELDADETGTLLSRLAHDSDLQAEMRDMLMLRQGFRAELFTPTPDLTEKVFQRTVLADQSARIGSGTASAGISGSRGQVLLAALISGVASSLLTLLVVTQVIPGSRVAGSVSTGSVKDMPIAPVATVPHTSARMDSGAVMAPAAASSATIVAAQPATVATSVTTKRSTVAGSRHVRIATKATAVPSVSSNSAASSVAESRQFLTSIDRLMVQAAPVVMADSMMSSTQEPTVRLLPGDTPVILSRASPEQGDEKFSLSLRGFTSRSFPEFTLDPLTDPPLNNIAIGMLYNLSDHHALGVEFGQEHFMQRYEGTANGGHVTFDQNYLALWGGAVYQYRFGRIEEFGGIEPVARGMVGGMRTGPLGRLTLGAQLDYGRVVFMAGAEGALAVYTYQGRWFASRTLGATYGFSIQF
jgi:anti-sigma factor RsiW